MDELQKQLDAVKVELQERDSTIQEKNTKITELESSVATLTTQNTELTEYKTAAEAKIQREQKLQEIKTKFEEAGVKKDDQYFIDNADTLLAFEENELEFVLQEMISLGTSNSSVDPKTSEKIPNLLDKKQTKVDAKELGRQLRDMKL